jgi:hypothetical protein
MIYDEGNVMARPLLFEVKLTDAERAKRYRDRRRQELKNGRADGKVQRVEPGKWYCVVDCRQCGKQIPFAESASPDEEPFPKSAGVSVRCAHCRFESTYVGPLISRQPGPKSK